MTPNTNAISPADRDLLAKAKAAQAVRTHAPNAATYALNEAASPAAIIDLITRLGEAQAALTLIADAEVGDNLSGMAIAITSRDVARGALALPVEPSGFHPLMNCQKCGMFQEHGHECAAQAPAAEGRES